MAGRYFEDFTVGEVLILGQVTVSEAEIVAYARQFDPQPFHTDPERAKTSVFGGLIASGWHTVALYMRLLGDGLTGRMTILELIPSKSRPDRGTIRTLGEMVNERGEVVMTMRGLGFFGRRPR